MANYLLKSFTLRPNTAAIQSVTGGRQTDDNHTKSLSTVVWKHNYSRWFRVYAESKKRAIFTAWCLHWIKPTPVDIIMIWSMYVALCHGINISLKQLQYYH